MPRHLVIVESPAKARTLGRYLGGEYAVRASLGHVRDLPREQLGVDVARGFTAEYEVLPGRRRVLAELAAAARDVDTIILAADPDREGEAICWHLAQALAGPRRRFARVAFHEITRRAVLEAFAAPREIDARRVDAQQARRILDRLVGYSLSPLVSQKLSAGLSAGRVQSVALRIVCERERAIRSFVPEEHWTIRARLDAGTPPVLVATLGGLAQEARLGDARSAREAVRGLEKARFRDVSLAERQRRRPPPPPFTTSTLQQEAFRRLRFGVKKTMQLAQRLYEGVELGTEGAAGLISYMRTDSTRVSPEAAAAAREHVRRAFGPEYVPATPNEFRCARAAQDAHEAIRPTDLALTPEALSARLVRDELALYTLIFERFVASQMASAVCDETLVEIAADAPGTPAAGPPVLLRAKGSTLRFRGFQALYEPAADESSARDPAAILPPLREGQELALVKVDSEQEWSEPPPRFSEASLVQELERCGIGRPSTYAAILATLLERDYVEKAKGRLQPTPLGFSVTELLVGRFPELLSVGYTAAMEEGLDAIEEGRASLLGTLGEFWARFAPALEAARSEPAASGAEQASAAAVALDPVLGRCPACQSPLVARQGRYGPFVGCSRYPRCRHVNARPAAPAGVACPLCHEGRVVERRAAERTFFGCSRYPACRFTSSYRPLPESCPECGESCLFEKHTRRDGRVVFCGNEACRYQRSP